MPGLVAHYIFGTEAYHKVTCDMEKHTFHLKKTLFANHGVYSLGLQGPALFFYSLPY